MDIFRLCLARYAKLRKKICLHEEKFYHRYFKDRIGCALARSIDRPRVVEALDDIAKKATLLQANRTQS